MAKWPFPRLSDLQLRVQKATLNHLRMDSIRRLTEPEVTNRPFSESRVHPCSSKLWISINRTQLIWILQIFRHPTTSPHHGFPTMLLEKLQINRWIQSNDFLHRCLVKQQGSPSGFVHGWMRTKKTWALGGLLRAKTNQKQNIVASNKICCFKIQICFQNFVASNKLGSSNPNLL